MNKLCWKEFSKSGELKVRNKSFKNSTLLRDFAKQLFKKTEFLEIVSYGEEG